MLRLRIWFLQELGLMNFILKRKVKKKWIETIEKIMRGMLSDSTAQVRMIPFFLNSEASEREDICGEVVRLKSLFASVLRYIPAKSGGQLSIPSLTGLVVNMNLKPQLPVANTINSKSVGARHPRNPCYESGPNC